jgi:hypothetical protein
MTGLPALDDLVAKIREIAASSPDYIYVRPSGKTYGSCYNVHRDEKGNIIPDQGCIIGRGLTALGWVPRPGTVPVEGQQDPIMEDKTGVTTLYWTTIGGFEAAPEVMRKVSWLAAVQSRQDNDATWGQAVYYADVNYPIEA